MGMSPRIKAKKGRFGVGGLPPVLTVEAYPASVTTTVGATGFEASASDDIDGDLTAAITWTSDLDAALVGTGGTPTITLTAVGTHTITVSTTGGTGSQTTTQDITVECVA